MTTSTAGALSEAVATEHEHDWVITRDASTRCRICGINKRYATPTAPAVSEADQFDESIRAIRNGEVTLNDVDPAVAAEPSDEQIRELVADWDDCKTMKDCIGFARAILALRQGTASK